MGLSEQTVEATTRRGLLSAAGGVSPWSVGAFFFAGEGCRLGRIKYQSSVWLWWLAGTSTSRTEGETRDLAHAERSAVSHRLV